MSEDFEGEVVEGVAGRDVQIVVRGEEEGTDEDKTSLW